MQDDILIKKKWDIIKLQIENGISLDEIYLQDIYREQMTSDEFKNLCHQEYLLDKNHPERLKHYAKKPTKHSTNLNFTDEIDKPKNRLGSYIIVSIIITVSCISLYLYYNYS